MTATDFASRLFLLDSAEALDALIVDTVDDSRFPGRFALWALGQPEVGAAHEKWLTALSDLGGAALVPMAETPPMPEAADEVWIVRAMSEEFSAFRHEAAKVLNHLLANLEEAPPLPEGVPYQMPPGTRVCDLAYVLLVRTLHIEASPGAFFRLKPYKRDQEIEVFRKSRAYRSFFEDVQHG